MAVESYQAIQVDIAIRAIESLLDNENATQDQILAGIKILESVSNLSNSPKLKSLLVSLKERLEEN